MSRTPLAASSDALATTVRRLAVLLGAGIAPANAWGYLATPAVNELIAAGQQIDAAIAGAAPASPPALASAWRALAAAWSVAEVAGAPLASTLRDVSESLRSLAATERAVALALTSPRATARIVLVLPAVGLLFGVVLGFDTIGVLVGTPLGVACLVLGAALMLTAWRWNRHLVQAATPTDAVPGIALDLTAIAVAGGMPGVRARDAALAALDRHGLGANAEITEVDDVLALSGRAGVPAVELLRATAADLRARSAATAQQRAEKLGVTLMLPLGVCVLPAFILVGVVPLVVAVVSSTVSAL